MEEKSQVFGPIGLTLQLHEKKMRQRQEIADAIIKSNKEWLSDGFDDLVTHGITVRKVSYHELYSQDFGEIRPDIDSLLNSDELCDLRSIPNMP